MLLSLNCPQYNIRIHICTLHWRLSNHHSKISRSLYIRILTNLSFLCHDTLHTYFSAGLQLGYGAERIRSSRDRNVLRDGFRRTSLFPCNCHVQFCLSNQFLSLREGTKASSGSILFSNRVNKNM